MYSTRKSKHSSIPWYSRTHCQSWLTLPECFLQLEESILELLNTLECPICLDTADQEPIYQCPEGHLLCDSCNHHLTDCPQCGHALMNSRNRTAEDLAVKLQVTRILFITYSITKIMITNRKQHNIKKARHQHSYLLCATNIKE